MEKESLTTIRPWGNFKILSDNENYKVKQITVSPGCRLSYQYHNKRSETWVIIEGTGLLTLDDAVSLVIPGKTVSIPLKSKHRIENTHATENLVFVEVQSGMSFEEEDIIRLDDDYGRID
jgi:mannose-6-phosphate isomerase